jgi:hypothetical protein
LLAAGFGYLAASPRRWLATTVVMAMAAAILVPSAQQTSRPILGPRSVFRSDRTDLMFRLRPELHRPTVEVSDCVARLQPGSVGLRLLPDDWEYPLQKLIRAAAEPPPSIHPFNGFLPAKPASAPPAPEVVVAYDSASLTIRPERGGNSYSLIRQFPPYSVYGLPRYATSVSVDYPSMPFVGWDKATGLGLIEGPYPGWDRPAVRWGLGPKTTLAFDCGMEPVRLHVAGWHNEPSRSPVVVRCNGAVVGAWTFGAADGDRPSAFLLPSVRGTNEVTFEYCSWDRRDPRRPAAVLFRQLQILPDSIK